MSNHLDKTTNPAG